MLKNDGKMHKKQFYKGALEPFLYAKCTKKRFKTKKIKTNVAKSSKRVYNKTTLRMKQIKDTRRNQDDLLLD